MMLVLAPWQAACAEQERSMNLLLCLVDPSLLQIPRPGSVASKWKQAAVFPPLQYPFSTAAGTLVSMTQETGSTLRSANPGGRSR